MDGFTRRGFLVTCLGAMAPVTAGEDGLTYVYAGESFSGEMGAPLIVGCLWTVKPADHLAALRDLRQGSRFSGKFVYHSGDRYKAGYARELCHYFSHDPELRFAANVVYSSRRTETFPEAFRRNEYCELVSRIGMPHTAVLRAKARKTLRRYRKPALRGNDLVKGRIHALLSRALISRGELITRSAHDGLLDLNTMLTGIIGSAWRAARYAHFSQAKVDLVERLRALLEIPNLETSVSRKWEIYTRSTGQRA